MKQADRLSESLSAVEQILIRCIAMAAAGFAVWVGFLVLAGDLTYEVHRQVVPVSRAQFDGIHYAGMMITKAVIFLFFVVPWIATRLVRRQPTAD